MKRVIIVASVLVLRICNFAQADVFNLGAGLRNLETVEVGDVGDLADIHTNSGGVDYVYSIGKYEVTPAQYCDFLNHKANESDSHGLYNNRMWNDAVGCKIQRSGSLGNYIYTVATGFANRPVNYVSFWDACRFANWLANGQGSGDTETGTYTLTDNGIANNTVKRNANCRWAVTALDEWYKAAYYAPHYWGGGPIYWLYPIQTNGIDTYMANWGGEVGHTTNVGGYGYASYYGTFDQGGNVGEWSDSIMRDVYRGRFGGSFAEDYHQLASVNQPGLWDNPTLECDVIGFRVSAVPEPSSILVFITGLGGVLLRRRR